MAQPAGPGGEPEARPTLRDWIAFAVIVALGGSSFAMIRGAVDTVPPSVVSVARLWVGAVFLYAVMKQAGRRFPPLVSDGAITREWRWIAAVAIVGYVGPFFLYPWAQQYIESGLAGVYMAFMPLFTMGLAYLFAGEALTARKIAGFALGFIGVGVLLGPAAFSGAASSSLVAQLALLAASLGYAGAAVITRRAPTIRPRVFAAGTLLCAATLSTPALFLFDLKADQWSLVGLLNVVGLGLGPTGLGGVLLIIIIQRVGAGFMALANYLTPAWAVIAGAIVFGERLEPFVFVALGVILAGVAVSQSGRRGSQRDASAQERDGVAAQDHAVAGDAAPDDAAAR
ncbi:MAG: DMT family transporter [Pseudomonadota bacterium]